ncbi:hypothetical protein Hanom_Chr16g01502871 [Helianthus anomalus]
MHKIPQVISQKRASHIELYKKKTGFRTETGKKNRNRERNRNRFFKRFFITGFTAEPPVVDRLGFLI